MKVIDNELVLNQLQWRYATKKFDTARKILPQDLETLQKILTLSPSSFGLQPWKFLVISNNELREKLKAVSWNQSQITDASHLIVFCIKEDIGRAEIDALADRICEVRNITEEQVKDYKNMMLGFVVENPPPRFDVNVWSSKQTYLALGFLLHATAILGIDSCPMEGFDAARYDEILNLKSQRLRTVVVCPIGYRSSDDEYGKLAKVRFEQSEVIQLIE